MSAPAAARPTTLYRLFAADGSLLYVGITATGYSRLHQHSRDKAWWKDVALARFEHHPSVEAAALAESVAIEREQPRHNRASGIRFGPKALRRAGFAALARELELLAEDA